MKYTDEQIEKLLLDRDYFKVVDALVDIVQTDEAAVCGARVPDQGGECGVPTSSEDLFLCGR